MGLDVNVNDAYFQRWGYDWTPRASHEIVGLDNWTANVRSIPW